MAEEIPGKKRKQKRRGRGEGTVYQRRDGRWVAELTLEDGKRRPFYGKTQEEAIAKLKQAEYEKKQGILATGPKQKLEAHLIYWLEEVHKLKIRHTSYLRYRAALYKHILPALGDIPLQKLTTQRIQAFYNTKLREHQSSSSVHTMHKILHKALDYAVHIHLIPFNPSDHITLPPQAKRKVPLITLEQARHLLRVAEGSRLEMLLILALTTGMRHGELIALRWEDINLEQGAIYVHRTAMYIGGKVKSIEGEPKTAAGERTIPISRIVCDKLKAHKARQNVQRLKAGPHWEDHNLVCCTTRGNFLMRGNVLKTFYGLLDKAGLPRMHIHDLRHMAASFFQSMGVSPKVVAEIFGHTNVGQTYDYTHGLPGAQIAAAERMDALFL
jgi:integrase